MFCLSALAQAPDRRGIAFEPSQSKLKMNTDLKAGSFTVRAFESEPGELVLVVKTTNSVVDQGVVSVFYRASHALLTGKDGKPISLLLSATTTIPLIGDSYVGTDSFRIPWSSVEFIRVVACKEIERADIGAEVDIGHASEKEEVSAERRNRF
jgi:hypothetical protein